MPKNHAQRNNAPAIPQREPIDLIFACAPVHRMAEARRLS